MKIIKITWKMRWKKIRKMKLYLYGKYREAYRIVTASNRASHGFLQRQLGIGFYEADLLMEMLTRHGVISPEEGMNPRVVLKSGYNYKANGNWLEKLLKKDNRSD